jgi:glycosidase
MYYITLDLEWNQAYAEKALAVEKLKMASTLQFTLPGVPCVYYGDENGMEGYIDPFCRDCFDWNRTHEVLLSHYRKLGEIRENLKEVFKDGTLEEIFVHNGCYVFLRQKAKNRVYVYANNCAQEFSVLLKSGKYQNLLTNEQFENSLTIKPNSYGIIKKLS